MTEHAPSCNRVRKMWHEHVSRNELLPWTAEGYTHTRVRTNHGTYTTEEPGKHSPMELANLPSTQVRDYINRRDRPYKPFTLADLRPDNPLAEHTWQRKWRAPTWNPNLPVLSTISMEFLYNASPDETQATTSSPPSREPAKTQETRQEKSGQNILPPCKETKCSSARSPAHPTNCAPGSNPGSRKHLPLYRQNPSLAMQHGEKANLRDVAHLVSPWLEPVLGGTLKVPEKDASRIAPAGDMASATTRRSPRYP